MLGPMLTVPQNVNLVLMDEDLLSVNTLHEDEGDRETGDEMPSSDVEPAHDVGLDWIDAVARQAQRVVRSEVSYLS
jgi:hypothetical protein